MQSLTGRMVAAPLIFARRPPIHQPWQAMKKSIEYNLVGREAAVIMGLSEIMQSVRYMPGCEGLELEANTLLVVRQRAEEVPVPEETHTWIDHDLSRTFLIPKRVSQRDQY